MLQGHGGRLSVWTATHTCGLGLPTLLVHGELDGESPVYHSLRLKDKLGSKAELQLIPGVHHCYETAAAQADVAAKVRNFLLREFK